MHLFHHNRRVDLGYEAHNNALRQFGKDVSRQPHFVGIRTMKKTREPQLVIIRNKFTREVVDLEVSKLLVVEVSLLGLLRRENYYSSFSVKTSVVASKYKSGFCP